LIARRSPGDDAQDSSVPGCDTQFFDALAKTIRRVGAELSEKKSGAGWPLWARFHKTWGSLKKLLAKCNRSFNERFMQTTNTSKNGHRGPHPAILAIVYTLLFNAGLYQVVSFTGGPHFPGPWESGEAITTYFQTYPKTVLICAFLQFGAAIPLGIFAATMVSRLQFLGVRAAGPYIALFGGLMTAFNMAASAFYSLGDGAFWNRAGSGRLACIVLPRIFFWWRGFFRPAWSFSCGSVHPGGVL